MKYTYKSIIGCAAIVMGLSSCEKKFLEMPLSNTTTIDSIFSTAQKAQGAWANAYVNCLSQGLPTGYDWNAMIQGNLSGELSLGTGMSRPIVLNGMFATGRNEDIAGYTANFPPIRQAYLVIENIDRVKDLSDGDKAIIKAEMKALIAYRYEQMLIMYGGVPVVSKSLEPANDELNIPRSTVKDVLDSIVTWCDQSIPVLPSVWSDNWRGRMTKAAAMAIKAKALLHAARPLFNSATPYLGLGANNGLVCLGNYDANRWAEAVKASEALITEAETNGGIGIINTGNPLADYGTATGVPSNKEIILAYKWVNTNTWAANNWNELPMNAFYNPRFWQATSTVLITNHLERYLKQDGTEQAWPNIDEVRPFADYTARMNEMEARFKISYMPFQMDAVWSNPGNSNWINTAVGNGPGWGVARSVKFYYLAGGRRWFEFPIFRLASAYLSSAEAYNEANDPDKALARLNVIRKRAGLPDVTERDQVRLRAIIQREWAVEMHNENYRLHDVKHWKLTNLGNGVLGGGMRAFVFNGNTAIRATGNTDYTDRVVYTAVWAPRLYLNPFPQAEINKGVLIQNPGY